MTLSADQLHARKTIAIPDMLPAIAHRWSPRAYSNRAVTPGDLRLVIEAARWAASSSNGQPWRFLVGRNGDDAFQRIAATLVPFNQAWAPLAPVLLLAYAAARTPHGNTNHYALFDLGQAVAQMSVQASALGLATHAMGGFDRAAAQSLIGPAEEFLPGVVLALGHPGDPAQIADPDLHARELDPRSRKPLDEIVFHAPGQPFQF